MATTARAEQGARGSDRTQPEASQTGTTAQTMGRMVDSARAAMVFGEPITRDGVTVIPVARVNTRGGGGGGTGPAQNGQTQRGRGGGFGLSARPVGVFVLRNGAVAWRPSVDINKIVVGGQIVAGLGILALRSLLRARRR
jgi:uncharacterized spore protein YtfJ